MLGEVCLYLHFAFVGEIHISDLCYNTLSWRLRNVFKLAQFGAKNYKLGNPIINRPVRHSSFHENVPIGSTGHPDSCMSFPFLTTRTSNDNPKKLNTQ